MLVLHDSRDSRPVPQQAARVGPGRGEGTGVVRRRGAESHRAGHDHVRAGPPAAMGPWPRCFARWSRSPASRGFACCMPIPPGIDDDLIRTIAAERKDRSLSGHPHSARQRPGPQGHAPAGYPGCAVPAGREPQDRYVRYCSADDRNRGLSGRDTGRFRRIAGVHSSRPIRRPRGVHLLPRGRHACGRDARPGPRRGQAGPVRRTDAGAAGDRVRQKQEPHRQQTRRVSWTPWTGIPAEAQVGGPGPQAGDVSMDRPRISTASASSRDAPRPRDNSSQ